MSFLLLTTTASAAPYSQQTSFGVPAPLIQAAQVGAGLPASWEALPPLQQGRLESRVVEVAPFDELIPSWNVTGTATSPLSVEVRVRRADGRWTPYAGFGTWRASGVRGSAPIVRRADGTVRDTVMFSITAEDWPDVRRTLSDRVAAYDALT